MAKTTGSDVFPVRVARSVLCIVLFFTEAESRGAESRGALPFFV